ncbi:hypothetical protein DFH28DRAFT_1226368 [Melampsora americana]|nr:hypothetical protein DFH28DRAFT_1226368 [Melampsora americana]
MNPGQICTGYKNVGQIMILAFNLSPTTTTTTIKTPTTTTITTFASSSTEAHPSIMLGFLFGFITTLLYVHLLSLVRLTHILTWSFLIPVSMYQPVKIQSQVDQILVIEPRSWEPENPFDPEAP